MRQELKEAGYSGFGFDSSDTAVAGLSGEWVSGEIAREAASKHENQLLLIRILDAVSGDGGAVAAAPKNAPESRRDIVTEHGLEVMIISVLPMGRVSHFVTPQNL